MVEKDQTDSMTNYAKLESQKNLVSMLIQHGFKDLFNPNDIEELLSLVLSKLETIDLLRVDLIKNDQQIKDIATKSSVGVESVVDYFLFISLLIENSFLIKKATELGINLYDINDD